MYIYSESIYLSLYKYEVMMLWIYCMFFIVCKDNNCWCCFRVIGWSPQHGSKWKAKKKVGRVGGSVGAGVPEPSIQDIQESWLGAHVPHLLRVWARPVGWGDPGASGKCGIYCFILQCLYFLRCIKYFKHYQYNDQSIIFFLPRWTALIPQLFSHNFPHVDMALVFSLWCCIYRL